MYVGGQEHATKHLLYARFIIKVLCDSGYLDFDEPFKSLRHQGLILGLDDQKMSKSRGNVVDPGEVIREYGSDAVRIYLCFMGPYEQGGQWNPKAIVGVFRFLNRVWNLINSKSQIPKSKQISNPKIQNKELDRLFHNAIKKIGEDIKNLKFNTAISELMKLLNEIENAQLTKSQIEMFLKLLLDFYTSRYQIYLPLLQLVAYQ